MLISTYNIVQIGISIRIILAAVATNNITDQGL